MFSKQRPDFVLKSHPPMMLLLAGDVADNLLQVRLAYRKIGVPALPGKTRIISTLLLQPLVGDALQLFDPVGLADSPAETCQNVYVVLHAPDNYWRTIQPFGNLTQIC